MTNTNGEKKIIRSFERVDFPDFGVAGMTAKIDTGAYTGALHCTKIRVEEKKTGNVLHFSPFDQPERDVVSTDFRLKKVRSSNGRNQKRYFIDTNITVNDETYPITLSLADRSDMKWPVLIGRRFLRRYNFLVDVGRSRNVS